MAKALIGHLNSDLRDPRLAVENARLRNRVAELESLVLRLSEENDKLMSARAAEILTVDAPGDAAGLTPEHHPLRRQAEIAGALTGLLRSVPARGPHPRRRRTGAPRDALPVVAGVQLDVQPR